MTREEIENGLFELKAESRVARNFQEAYANGVSFYFSRRKKYIIPTLTINRKFGFPDYQMDKEATRVLMSLGGKRTTRQIYKDSKVEKVVSVWVFSE